MVQYQTRSTVSIAEVWYAESAPALGADLIQYVGLKNRVERAWRTEEFWTIWIDLSLPEDTLFGKMHRTTRLEVRRAGDYGLQYAYSFPETGAKISEFIDFYDRFSRRKDLPSVDPRWLKSHIRAGTLDLSCVRAPDGKALAWHAHYRDAVHAQVVWSASAFRESEGAAFRRMVSRANRHLHWHDIRRYKREGLRVYDFGGWYCGSADQDLLRVNEFKEGFGGEIVRTFRCTRPLTFKGRLFLCVAGTRAIVRRAALDLVHAVHRSNERSCEIRT